MVVRRTLNVIKCWLFRFLGLRATAEGFARLSHCLDVCLSVCLSIWHTRDLYQNGVR